MYNAATEAYLESRVLSASPVELVALLYGAAIEAVRDARRCIAGGDIEGRSKGITKAGAIIVELTASLDAARGGEIARRLAALYAYMLERLADANLHQSDALLAEILGLLSTLSEAWKPAEEPAVEPRYASEWNPAIGGEPAYASSSWTL